MKTERMTFSVSVPVAAALKAEAAQRGASRSELADRAIRDYLIRNAAARESGTDGTWLEAAAETVLEVNG